MKEFSHKQGEAKGFYGIQGYVKVSEKTWAGPSIINV